MAQLTLYQLEEHEGHKFYVEFVGIVPLGYWFRIHLVHGTHNFTIESDKSIDEARKEVIQSYKQYLDEHPFNKKSM
jgi:hypothetical protein